MRKRLVVVLFFFLLSTSLMAQITVTGIVTGSSSVPISGVKVSLKDSEISTFTDSLGKYTIRMMVGSSYLQFEKNGYKTQIVYANKGEINISMPLLIEKDILELSIEELMNIEVVTASKYAEKNTQSASNILVISRNDIRNRGYISLYEVMSDIPGFDIAAAYSNETMLTYARGNRTGSFNERTMLMINGIESNILYSQLMNISSDFPLSSIKRIEVISGPASTVYGSNVFSGIINIITEDASELNDKDNKIHTQSGLGSNNTQFAEITYLTKQEPFHLSLSYRRFKSDLFDISNRPGYFANNTIIGNPNIWGPYAAYYKTYDNKVDNDALLVKVNLKNLEIGYNHLATTQGNGSEYPYDKTLPTTDWKFKRDILYIKANKNITPKFNYSFLATYQNCGALPDAIFAQGWNSFDHWDSTRTVEMLSFKYISKKWGFSHDYEYQPTNIIKINGGIKFSSGQYQKSYEHGYSSQTSWLPGSQWTEPNVLFPPSAPQGFTPGNSFVENEWGAFIQNKILLLNGKASLLTGIRYDKNSNHGEIFSPRLGATYSINENINLKSSYGTGFQIPAPRNLYGSWGGLTSNKDLKPDKIQALDLGVSTKILNVGVEVTTFYNQIKNSILQTKNLPTKNIIGAECKLNYILPPLSAYIKNTSLHFNYSYLNARYASTRSDEATGRKSDNIGDVAPHKFNLILNTEILNYFHANIRLNYVGERETEISNPIKKVDSYLLTNLNLQVVNLFDNKLSLFVSINNLFDIEYYHPGIDKADAGEDLTSPSNGWYSSRLPQPSRSITFGMYLDL